MRGMRWDVGSSANANGTSSNGNADRFDIAASGLYYLSELVEEHTVLAKRLLTQLIYSVIGVQLLLLVFDGFPLGLSALSVGSHVLYAQNLRRFPIVKLTDPLFLISCGMLTHIRIRRAALHIGIWRS